MLYIKSHYTLGLGCFRLVAFVWCLCLWCVCLLPFFSMCWLIRVVTGYNVGVTCMMTLGLRFAVYLWLIYFRFVCYLLFVWLFWSFLVWFVIDFLWLCDWVWFWAWCLLFLIWAIWLGFALIMSFGVGVFADSCLN